jgi:hypothetical protein
MVSDVVYHVLNKPKSLNQIFVSYESSLYLKRSGLLKAQVLIVSFILAFWIKREAEWICSCFAKIKSFSGFLDLTTKPQHILTKM